MSLGSWKFQFDDLGTALDHNIEPTSLVKHANNPVGAKDDDFRRAAAPFRKAQLQVADVHGTLIIACAVLDTRAHLHLDIVDALCCFAHGVK